MRGLDLDLLGENENAHSLVDEIRYTVAFGREWTKEVNSGGDDCNGHGSTGGATVEGAPRLLRRSGGIASFMLILVSISICL